MTVNSDVGYSYISEQWRKTISLGTYKLKLVITLSELTLTPAGFAQQEQGSYSNVWIVFYNLYTVPAEVRRNCISSS